jgi:alpha-beta hydrolase superfamily lysophospholipase
MPPVSGDERISLAGSEGQLSVRVWPHPAPERIVVLSHGYGEHIGRYEHVAAVLVERGAVVYGPDHLGHGESEGERVLIRDFEHVVDDLHTVVLHARGKHPGLPVVLVAHSMGGLIGARYAQRHGDELAGLVLSAPSIGLAPVLAPVLVQLPEGTELPDEPIDPSVLSRDPSVGEAYANDVLVWHGGWKRTTLAAFHRANEAVDAGGGFGDLPVLYIHGEVDQLVPRALAQPAVERLQGADFTEHIVPGARHETFNELDKKETIGLVADFVERVTARGAH